MEVRQVKLLIGSVQVVVRKAKAHQDRRNAQVLLEKAHVAVSPGVGFGPMGEGHVRFALVENDQRIRQATRAIGQFLKA